MRGATGSHSASLEQFRDAERAVIIGSVSAVARGLASEDGRNVECDRALVDLLSGVLAMPATEAARTVLSPESPLTAASTHGGK
ncbi:MAG: hypothetical protein JWM93_1061 [Frankiales bacterium]|nr:hypothetical protein [Frankiales bacterium]